MAKQRDLEAELRRLLQEATASGNTDPPHVQEFLANHLRMALASLQRNKDAANDLRRAS